MDIDFNDSISYIKTVPARQAVYAEYPESLNTELKEFLKQQGIDKLYFHQAEMYEKAVSGQHVVITTATASGKTLGFLLPVLQEILANPLARAIFVYPTKALASDQYRALKPYVDFFGKDRLNIGVYDGDTSVNERRRIRKSANIILTNPEMLNGTFLPNHSRYGFDFIFSNLKYIVIDELHTYRGAFGSHLANVFRRLNRVCRYYTSAPQFLCSSATIANPLELASEICGKEFTLDEKDGSPAAKRNYILVQPPKIVGKDGKYYGQIPAVTVAADMLPALAEEGKTFIAFAKSRRNVEVILKEARDKMESGSLGKAYKDRISGYRGGYTPLERKTIEKKMAEGKLIGLVSTNALELGIDIGSVDTTVLAGYPGTRASFWQQTGRAGRNQTESMNYMILEQLPFDQYIAINPDWLFCKSSENAVIDKNNLLIELAHIRAAAAELPLTLEDTAVFPDLGETIPVLIGEGELQQRGGSFAWIGNAFPAGDYSLRNIDKIRYKLINQENGHLITEMDEMQAFREVHEGAVYLHDGVQYQVTHLERETHTAYAKPFAGNYYTIPGGHTDIHVLHMMQNKDYERTKIAYGDVIVHESIFMYKKLQFHNHENLGYENLPEPLSKQFETESTWITLPSDVVTVYRRLLIPNVSGTAVHNNHFEGLCYAVKNAARMFTMTEEEDIGAVMSSNAVMLGQTCEDEVGLYIYDKYTGGLGYSEKIYDCIEDIIRQAIELVGGCSCDHGCAACIGDYKLDKSMVLWGLNSLLQQSQPPKGIKLPQYAKSFYIQKEFVFQELEERWQEFVSYLKEKGEKMAAFLETVKEVKIEGNTLTLFVSSPFYREWIEGTENKKSLTNIVAFYTEAPENIAVRAAVLEQDNNRKQVQEKLQRRYRNLKNDETNTE